MKRTILLFTAALFFFAFQTVAQQSDADKSNTPEKGGTYVSGKAPVTGTTIKIRPAVTGTGAINTVTPSDDFPVFVDTGDAAKDAENYRVAKEEWIARNPEKYRQMQNSNNPQK